MTPEVLADVLAEFEWPAPYTLEEDLAGCVLDWAWLIQCDMREAVLENASFRGTRIVEARLYNSRRFHLGADDQARVDGVDMSPAGDGSVIVQGDELWAMLDSGPAA